MGRGKKSQFYKRVNILYLETFWRQFYKKHPEYNNIDQKDMRKLAYEFFNTCGDLLVTKPNGIVIDGIGYFSNVVFNVKKIFTTYTTHINLITNGYIYRSYMFPRIFKYLPMNNWSFKIESKRKKQMAEQIRGGIKYLCHYNLLKKQKNNGREYYLRRIYK